MQVQVSNGKIIIDNHKEVKIPSRLTKDCNSIVQINDKLYVNGYEYNHGYWKRTLKALWHLWF